MISLATAPIHPQGTMVTVYPALLFQMQSVVDGKRKFTYNDFLIHTHVFLFTEIQKSHIYQCIDVGSHYKKIDQNGYFLSGSLFFHRAL